MSTGSRSSQRRWDIEGLYVEALVNAAVLKYSYGVVRLPHLETGKDIGGYVLKCIGARRDLVQLRTLQVLKAARKRRTTWRPASEPRVEAAS